MSKVCRSGETRCFILHNVHRIIFISFSSCVPGGGHSKIIGYLGVSILCCATQTPDFAVLSSTFIVYILRCISIITWDLRKVIQSKIFHSLYIAACYFDIHSNRSPSL